MFNQPEVSEAPAASPWSDDPHLVLDSNPPMRVKTFDAETVVLGGYLIPMAAFMTIVMYILTNTDLVESDPRREFVERVKSMQLTPGRNQGGQRLFVP